MRVMCKPGSVGDLGGQPPRSTRPIGCTNPARAALAFLAREYTQATLAELVPVLGLSRPESVPNLTKRFSTWLAGPTDARENRKKLRRQLGLGNN